MINIITTFAIPLFQGTFFLFISGNTGLILFGVFYTLGNLIALAR